MPRVSYLMTPEQIEKKAEEEKQKETRMAAIHIAEGIRCKLREHNKPDKALAEIWGVHPVRVSQKLKDGKVTMVEFFKLNKKMPFSEAEMKRIFS